MLFSTFLLCSIPYLYSLRTHMHVPRIFFKPVFFGLFLWSVSDHSRQRYRSLLTKNDASTNVSYDSCIFHRVHDERDSKSIRSLALERQNVLGWCTWLCPAQCVSRHVHRTVHRLPRSRAREFCIKEQRYRHFSSWRTEIRSVQARATCQSD